MDPKDAEKVARMTAEAKISRLWLQQGHETKAAIEFCEKNGIAVVYSECVLMFAEPVKGIHAFHRWLWKIFRLLPK
jgi:predicted CoA-binding protein